MILDFLIEELSTAVDKEEVYQKLAGTVASEGDEYQYVYYIKEIKQKVGTILSLLVYCA